MRLDRKWLSMTGSRLKRSMLPLDMSRNVSAVFKDAYVFGNTVL